MSSEPNGRKVSINLTLPPESKKWLQDHPWVNASGLLESAIQKLKGRLEDDDFFEPVR